MPVLLLRKPGPSASGPGNPLCKNGFCISHAVVLKALKSVG